MSRSKTAAHGALLLVPDTNCRKTERREQRDPQLQRQRALNTQVSSADKLVSVTGIVVRVARRSIHCRKSKC